MPTEHRLLLYRYDELSDTAKKNARAWYVEADARFFDTAEFTAEVLEEHARYCHGLAAEHCHWRLGYSQGDGVAFYGRLDLDELMKPPGLTGNPEHDGQFTTLELRRDIARLYEILARGDRRVSVQVHGGNGHYHHWNSMRVEVEAEAPGDFERLGRELLNLVEERAKELPKAQPFVAPCREALSERGDRRPLRIFLDWLDDHGELGAEVEQLRAADAGEGPHDAAVAALTHALDEFLKEVSRSTERVGYEEIDYRHSDDRADEMLSGSDYTFTADGGREDPPARKRQRKARR